MIKRHVVFLAVTMFACLFYLSTTLLDPSPPLDSLTSRVLQEHRNCINNALHRVPKDRWTHLAPLIRNCSRPHFTLHQYSNSGEIKRVVLPVGGESDCSLVTLGIGNDVGAELKLRKDFPNCRFFGADPSPKNGLVYRTRLGGTYFEKAVGAESGVLAMHVLVREGKARYQVREVPTVEFLSFLREDVKLRRIDHLWMDIEGPEYPVLRKYFAQRLLHQAGFSFCQVNVELHGPLGNYGSSAAEFDSLLEAVVADSGYLPIHMDAHDPHRIAVFFNVEDPECVRKYILR